MTKPLTLHETVVRAEWVDSYDHMNLANYVAVCDNSTYAFWELMNENVPQDQRGGAEYAVVETHVNYIQEVRLGDPLRITTQLLGADRKRYRIFHTMYRVTDDAIAATNEVMALGFDLNARRVSEFRPRVQANLQRTLAEHSVLVIPANAGRGISMPPAKPAG